MSSHRDLLVCWAVLIALTALSLTAGNAAGAVTTIGPMAAALVLAAGLFKAQQILWCYLGLARAPLSWRVFFLAFLLLLCGLILAAFVLGEHRGG